MKTMKESSWFSTIWRPSRKSAVLEPQNPIIEIMSFEVSRIMTRVANLWQILSDKQMSRLHEELANSTGTRKLVSEDHNHLIELALIEIIGNIKCVAQAVARLGKKCTNPIYRNLDHVFDDVFEVDVNWCGWEYKLKKMEKRVKKMKRFAAVSSQLCEELEVLCELENGLKRLQDNDGTDRMKLIEFEKKVLWQREEVNGLREMSTWVRDYDYVVRLLLRSIFTIIDRAKVVFGISKREILETRCFVRSNSVSTLSVYPSEKSIDRSISNLGDKQRKKLQTRYPPRAFCRTHEPVKRRSLAQIGPLKSCMTNELDSPKVDGTFQTPLNKRVLKSQTGQTGINPTLGDVGLALHYANVIIFIERLAISPHFISLESREDLYNMLTTSIKNSLRRKLCFSSKNDDSNVYKRDLANEWSSRIQKTLHWLSPLAHNMVKWHNERNFEKQQMGSGGNVLLVNTLHYADQVKCEEAITEVILGLHYISRFGREVNTKAFLGSVCVTDCDNDSLRNHNLESISLYD
ncbi:protein PSK SIMULATOR 1-like [Rutidosis leptorrhynchoides]|uniref:protein PSK SIMULATOR 1-like n=1 Tax=Rutidosis leptorrhynchoides TaxID=125765 RepID=UPI003A9A3A0E